MHTGSSPIQVVFVLLSQVSIVLPDITKFVLQLYLKNVKEYGDIKIKIDKNLF